MIDLGGLPLRFHNELQQIFISLDPISLEQMEENLDMYYEMYVA
jgi:hypothetical protein